MHTQQCARERDLRGKVSIRYGVEAVVRGFIESQGGRCRVAIDSEAGRRQRARSQRGLTRTPGRIQQPSSIAPQHFGVCEQMVSERDRLCALQVRVAG